VTPTLEDVADILGVTWVGMARALSRCKRTARKRRLPWELSFEEFQDLAYADCRYCGAAPANVVQVRDSGTTFRVRYQGIDRVDNARGYLPGNVVACCAPCNTAKGARPVGDFLARAARIAERAQ
jgi:hypothetical protein